MELSPSPEQQELVSSFSDLLAKHSSPERVRVAEPLGYDPDLWQSLLEIGAVQMAVPEQRGGWGADMVDLALVAECLGAAVAPAPVVEVQSAARLLASAGGESARDALNALLLGERIITMAVRPSVAGRATLVPGGAVAEQAIVLAEDRQLLLVDLHDDNRQRVDNLASAPLADVKFDSSSASEIASGAGAVSMFESAVDEWLSLTAAALVGIASAAHRVACEYARERKAWDLPIGSYQAVAHPLADDATHIDGARLLAYRAAWELASRRPRGRELASMAFAFSAETARKATYDALHFHGGYGFMLEYDAQLYFRRARGWSRVWGEPNEAYRRAGNARYVTQAEV
jgi:alkylation response protein AidB-like acyl-CoA dehydrogenase